MMLAACTLESHHIVELSYITRDLGYGDREADIIRAYWTGEVDTWGKFTIVPVDGSPILYLFPDEIVDVEAL